jgi:hypothetical protein
VYVQRAKGLRRRLTEPFGYFATARARAFSHAVLLTLRRGLPRQVKTAVACLPRRRSMIERATELSTQTWSCSFLRASPGIRNTLQSNSGTATSQRQSSRTASLSLRNAPASISSVHL